MGTFRGKVWNASMVVSSRDGDPCQSNVSESTRMQSSSCQSDELEEGNASEIRHVLKCQVLCYYCLVYCYTLLMICCFSLLWMKTAIAIVLLESNALDGR